MNVIDWKVVLIHILCYPIYQILGTIRHECSHAIACWLSGVRVKSIKVIPHRHEGSFYWGRIMYNMDDFHNFTVHICLAPYYVAVVHALAFGALGAYGVLEKIENPHLFAFVAMVLLISPIADLLYNICKYLFKGSGDFADAHEFIQYRR